MESFPDGCPHPSIPVETDESMTLSSLNLAWPACQECHSHMPDLRETAKGDSFSPQMSIHDVSSLDYSDQYCRPPPKDLRVSQTQHPIIKRPFNDSPVGLPSLYLHTSSRRDPLRDHRPQIEDLSEDFSDLNIQHLPVPYQHLRNPVSEDEESLEKPRSLCPDMVENMCGHSSPNQQRYGQCPPEAFNGFQYKHEHPAHCPQPNHPLYQQFPPQYGRYHPQNRSLPRPVAPLRPIQDTTRQSTARMKELISEVCVNPFQPAAAAVHPQTLTRNVSLPDDCRDVFITYSADITAELMPFVSFLINQGFRPAIDIFEDRVRQMDINKWMDSFLKNKSVLIIVVISPKYKADVEGDGSDQHGLHTKYIHTQIQNEFIQQGCLNFRLVPVLFPCANQSHVPLWLLNTRRYRWPEDAEDLLLRLLREEKYIVPPLGRELKLTIKPLQ